MEIPILDSILHRDLRPWKIDTTNKKRFSELVKPANTGSPGTCAELQKQLKTFLSDFPAEQKNLAASPPTAKAVLHPTFYEIELPKPFDVFSQFYFYIITKETLRDSNLLIQANEALTNETDIRYNAKLALKSIKRLIKKTAEELKASGYTAFPDSKSELKHFVLFTLKQMLMALFFEVQERYRTVLSDFETEESLCLTVLNENYSGTPQLNPTVAFFDFKIRKSFFEAEFSEQEAVELLTQMREQRGAKLQTLQTALENIVFLHSQPAGIANLTFEQLTNADSIAQQLSLAKKSITKQIQKHLRGHERLPIVQAALDELEEIQFTTKGKLSLPYLFNKWLQEQKAVYTARFSDKFPVVTSDEPEAKQKSNSSKKFSFSFSGDSAKLKSVLSQLSNQINLLDTDRNSVDDLLNVLTAKVLKPNSKQIYIACETAQFRYVIDKLKSKFSNLTLIAVEKSGAFYSKNNNQITSQNLSSGKIDNPKNKGSIDTIFKNLE